MDYNEFTTKWKTDEKVKILVDLVNVDTPDGVELYQNGYLNKAGMGDLIKDYVDHLNIKKRKRTYEWNVVEEKFRKILNEIQLQWSDL